jgi:hypothetical protein
MIRWPGIKIEPFVRIGQPAGSNRDKLGIAASVDQSARKLPLLLRKHSKTLAQYGSAALHSKEGARNQWSHPSDMRAHVGTDRQFDPLAVADRSVFWISMLFGGFGLFARANATAFVAHLIGAISVSTAIFLILKLNHP